MNYLLSIIIPTKNRYTTLLPLLDYLSSISSDSLEIVIQDNSDCNKPIIAYFKKKKDSRISYYHTTEKLSQTGNSDQAVLKAKGQYICFIGDDDGVMPYISDVAGWMKRECIDVVKSYKPYYSWPGLQSTYMDKDKTGVLKLKRFKYSISEVDLDEVLDDNLVKGGTEINKLPCLYHGIASKKTLNKIYNKTGSYFPGPSPDMANAIAMCFFAEKFVYTPFPIIISGQSSNSIGGKGVLHQHVAKIEDVNHLPKNTKANWSSKIPKYWTGPTVWAESVVKSLIACGQENKLKKFNYNSLYARLVVFNFRQRKLLFSGFKFNVLNFNFMYNVIKLFSYRVYTFFLNRTGLNRIKSYTNLKTIGDAVAIIDAMVEDNKLPF